MWQYHFVWGGWGSPEPCRLRWSSATPNSVILPHSLPESGSFVTIHESYNWRWNRQWYISCVQIPKWFKGTMNHISRTSFLLLWSFVQPKTTFFVPKHKFLDLFTFPDLEQCWMPKWNSLSFYLSASQAEEVLSMPRQRGDGWAASGNNLWIWWFLRNWLHYNLIGCFLHQNLGQAQRWSLCNLSELSD